MARLTKNETSQRWQTLTRLLEPIHKSVLGAARRLCLSNGEGDSIYQDAVLRAYDKLDTLRDETRFKSWFFAVLLSVLRTQQKRSFWQRHVPWTSSGIEVEAKNFSLEDETLGAFRMRRALMRLRPEQREALVLFEVEGFSIEEIAGVQGASVPAVKSRLVRGRSELKKHYERMDKLSFGATEPLSAMEAKEGGKL